MDNCYAVAADLNWNKNKDPKRENDSRLYSLIEEFLPAKKYINILTLPASGWCFESGLASKIQRPLRFTGIEKDDIVFSKASSTRKRLEAKFPDNVFMLHKVDSHEFLQTTSRQFDIVYLDWMGTWSQGKQQELETIFSRKVITHTALLVFTIWEGRGNGPEMDILDKLVKRRTVQFPFEEHVSAEMTPNVKRKTYGVAERVVRLARSEGYDATLAYFSEYKGNSRPPQLSFAFKLKRKLA